MILSHRQQFSLHYYKLYTILQHIEPRLSEMLMPNKENVFSLDDIYTMTNDALDESSKPFVINSLPFLTFCVVVTD